MTTSINGYPRELLNGNIHGDNSAASIFHVDPPMARRILQSNTRNRPVSELHVNRLMNEMNSGRWRYNGEAIKWSVSNELLDGQHRLIALSRLDDDSISLPFLVVRGLPSDSQDTMDQGRTRTAADQLVIDGLGASRNSKYVASAIRAYIWWQEGRMFGDQIRNKVSNTEVVEWAKSHPNELMVVSSFTITELKKVKARPSLVLAVMLKFHLIDSDAAEEFMRSLCSGAGLEIGNPILTLRERLDRISVNKLKLSERDVIGFFVLAWNAWRQGRKLTKFQRPDGSTWTAETFPRAL